MWCLIFNRHDVTGLNILTLISTRQSRFGINSELPDELIDGFAFAPWLTHKRISRCLSRRDKTRLPACFPRRRVALARCACCLAINYSSLSRSVLCFPSVDTLLVISELQFLFTIKRRIKFIHQSPRPECQQSDLSFFSLLTCHVIIVSKDYQTLCLPRPRFMRRLKSRRSAWK